MKRQISNNSRWHQMFLIWLLCLACLLLFMEGSIAYLTRQQLLDTCSNFRTKEALEADSFVDLMCDASGSPIIDNITWALQRIGDSQATPLMITAPKYTTDFNRLRVHDTATTDDGLYSCKFTFSGDTEETIRNAGCIYVLGTAKYATCSDHTSPCSETVPMVTSPEAFVLDVRIDFYLQGSSGFTQQIHRLNLSTSSGQAIYTCSNESDSEGVPCANSERIIVEGSRLHKYDITLRFTNSVPEDSGTYTATVEVENPHTSGRSDLIKTFTVNVNSDCGPPQPPSNGEVQPHSSTTEGSVVVYQCSTGFVPEEEMMAVCTTEGRWVPDPADLICLADCGTPVPPKNGSVTATNGTTQGSETVYVCDAGLVPSEQMTAVCREDRVWDPNPASLTCREPVDCGTPVPPQNGSVTVINGTTQGSEAVFVCDAGLVPSQQMTAVCREDRVWDPNPASLTCRELVDCGDPSPPISGFLLSYNNTLEESMVMFRCEEGFLPEGDITGVCAENGSWTPDPTSFNCMEQTDSELSVGVIVAAAMVLFIVTPSGGAIAVLVILYMKKHRYKKLNIDSVLLQLREVHDYWYQLGEALGVPTSILDDISFQALSSENSMQEMVDYWLRGHSGQPTWLEIEDALSITHLSRSIRQVHITGSLPVVLDALPPEDVPPPVPSRGGESPELPLPLPPRPSHSLSTSEETSEPPPIPPRGEGIQRLSFASVVPPRLSKQPPRSGRPVELTRIVTPTDDTEVSTYPCEAYGTFTGRARAPPPEAFAVECNPAYHTVLRASPFAADPNPTHHTVLQDRPGGTVT